MPDPLPQLFELSGVFIAKSQVQRARELPEQLDLKFNIAVNVDASALPELQVSMRVTNPSDQQVVIDIEVVSFFHAVNDATEIDRQLIYDFVNKKAAPFMWPYVDMTLRQASAMMELPLLKILMPLEFDVPFGDREAELQPPE